MGVEPKIKEPQGQPLKNGWMFGDFQPFPMWVLNQKLGFFGNPPKYGWFAKIWMLNVEPKIGFFFFPKNHQFSPKSSICS